MPQFKRSPTSAMSSPVYPRKDKLRGADGDSRLIYVKNDSKNQELRKQNRYTNNWVSTSKYTIVSFVPKTLFEFFRVIANMYFLFISIIQVS
ncbi:hypothetical protein AC1031_013216 [Aphanomyces cochlioides]|nr:hypothetical protein AC1031_013216 [Aphanomyces cochlioides]